MFLKTSVSKSAPRLLEVADCLNPGRTQECVLNERPFVGRGPTFEPLCCSLFTCFVCLSFPVVEDPAVRRSQPAVHRLSADVV